MVGYGLAILAATGFGLANIFIRMGMRSAVKDNGVGTTIMINFVLFGVLLLILGLLGKVPFLDTWGLVAFVAAGLMTTLMGRITQYASTRLIGPSRAATFKVASPIITVILSIAFLHETINFGMFWGIALVLFGLWLLSMESQRQTPAQQETAATSGGTAIQQSSAMIKQGLLLGALSASCFGAGRVLRKTGLLYIPSPVVGAFIGSTVAMITITLLQAYQQGQFSAKSGDWRRWMPHLSLPFLLAGLATAVGQLSNFGALYFTQVSVAGILVSTEPLMTLLLSWIFLRSEEAINLRIIGITGLVFAGVAVIILYS